MQHMAGKRLGRADAESSPRGACLTLRHLHDALPSGHQFAAVDEGCVSCLCQPEPPCGALKQLHAEFTLQPRNLTAHGRGRGAEMPRRCRKTPQFGDAQKRHHFRQNGQKRICSHHAIFLFRLRP